MNKHVTKIFSSHFCRLVTFLNLYYFVFALFITYSFTMLYLRVVSKALVFVGYLRRDYAKIHYYIVICHPKYIQNEQVSQDFIQNLKNIIFVPGFFGRMDVLEWCICLFIVNLLSQMIKRQLIEPFKFPERLEGYGFF